jgi:hypothetical protein
MVVVPIISHLYINKGVSHVLKPIIKSTIMASSYTNPKAKVHTPTPKPRMALDQGGENLV